jgi:MoaA/NifB/PqqE/SkfB family radical SAM enzyme
MNKNFTVLEPSIDPNNRIGFLLDWELTLKCNLDCSYCGSGPDGGHDNSTKHPPVKECIQTIDFMYEYVDLYMSTKPKGLKYVNLNMYGGESLHHPDAVEILIKLREKYEPYKDRWHLTITTTTNAIVSQKKLEKIIPLIDEFTVSYHTENTEKNKNVFKNNLKTIQKSGKRLKCIVLMHDKKEMFDDANDFISWLTENNIRYLPRQLDGDGDEDGKRLYSDTQITWFDGLYKQKTRGTYTDLSDQENKNLADVGRACCGGRQVCLNTDYQQRQFYVDNKFTDWYCSVNHFFLSVKQFNGNVFTNKDCKMNFDGTVSPLGNLRDTQAILDQLRTFVDTKTFPIIQCKKYKCLCGLCAPKAKDVQDYKSIMEKYQRL